MARTPLTLAATVTAALPGSSVTGVAALTEHAAGRYDAALAALEDGRRVVVRMPTDDAAAADLAAEGRALHALSAGVRALLPFDAPQVVGETGSGLGRTLVTDFLPGYRVDPSEVPAGRGIASAVGEALALVHALPISVVREAGLPLRSAAQARDAVERLLDRAAATRRVPAALRERWHRTVETDALWRFEATVSLDGASSSSFLFADRDGEPVVTGMLDWAGLGVGDPAVDLRWLATAPLAAESVHAGYVAGSGRAPDPLLRERARLYAELEFAKWLVHGHEAGDEAVVADAVALLEALASGLADGGIVGEEPVDLDAALSYAERVPEPVESSATSLQTDAYDPDELALYIAQRTDGQPDFGLDELREPEPVTAPVDIVGWPEADRETDTASDEDAERDAAEEASRAALRRWGADGDSSRATGA